MKKLLIGIALLIGFTNCTKDELVSPQAFIEAERWSENVDVQVYGDSRVQSTFLEENIDRFTATRVDTKANDFTLVSYHGRNKENIGMVQLIKDDVVLSEIVFYDSRVNFAQYRHHIKGDVAYIGLDKAGKDGLLCGILCVPIVDKKFKIESTTPYKVDGMSINCIKQHNGDTSDIGNDLLVVASGGNNNCPEAGFTKFQINTNNPTQLGVLAKEVRDNYRGYWFSFGYLNKAPLAYTYRTVEDNNLLYKVGVIKFSDGVDLFGNNSRFISDYNFVEETVYTEEGTTENFGRYCVIAIQKNPGYKFIIVMAGESIKAYRYTESSNILTLVDTWNKRATCLGTEIIDNGQMYIFAGLGDGVYKIALDFDTTNPDEATVYMRPVGKRKTTVLTESGTLSSINYIQVNNKKIHVAGGYEGYYVLGLNDFETCDKRKE